MSYVKLRKWMLVGILTVGCCCGLPALWLTGPQRAYPIGASISSLGVYERKDATFHWSPSSYEQVRVFAKRTGSDLAHFNGGIVLSKPGTEQDGLQIGLLDGKLASHYGVVDPSVDLDLEVLRAQRLREMVNTTTNDWRVYNVDNHFLEPTGLFTGRLALDGGGGWVYEHHVELIVQKDVIQQVSRRWYFGLVD